LILKPLEESDLKKLFQKTWGKILPSAAIPDDQVIQALVTHASGDARRLLNALEAISYEFQSQADPLVDLKRVAEILSAPNLTYDRNGEEHYNVISAFIKSMRGSDPDATLYYLARMLESGEDPRFVARRMIIFASEDVGNADSRALSLALDAAQAFERIGLPEGWIPLAHCATYLAAVPKSNAAYRGYLAAKRDVLNSKNETVPLHLRNAPTKLMKQLEYGKNYQYPHNDPGNWNDQTYLPEALKERIYYEPSQNGLEAKIKAYLDPIRKARRKTCQ
jgi:putative ATPase